MSHRGREWGCWKGGWVKVRWMRCSTTGVQCLVFSVTGGGLCLSGVGQKSRVGQRNNSPTAQDRSITNAAGPFRKGVSHPLALGDRKHSTHRRTSL